MKNLAATIYLLLTASIVMGQFTIHPSIPTGGINKNRINIIILADGYNTSINPNDSIDFFAKATQFQNYLFNDTTNNPFNKYREYFDIYRVYVNSDSVGAIEPCGSICDDTTCDPYYAVTQFTASYDNEGLDRFMYLQDPSTALDYVENTFGTEAFTTIMVFSGTEFWGGGGYPALGLCVASAKYPFASVLGLFVHELSHSFGHLRDEYYYGPWATEAPNMTANPDTTDPNFTWLHWINEQSITRSYHATTDTCDLTWNSSYYTDQNHPLYENLIYRDTINPPWFKPSHAYDCKMERATKNYCSVCKEHTIERIHSIVNPIDGFSPDTANTIIASSDTVFSLNLIPTYPSTMKVWWYINDSLVFTDITPPWDYQFDCSDTNLVEGINTLRAVVHDTTTLVRIASHSQPDTGHYYSVEWDVNFNGIKGVDLYTPDGHADIGDEPDTLVNPLYLSPYIWVVNPDDVDTTAHHNPEYSATPGDSSTVYVAIINRGCETYKSSSNEAMLHVYWAKASTALTWPDNWMGNFLPSTSLVSGDEIDSIAVPTVAYGDTVLAKVKWRVPDPAPYEVEYPDNGHFCLLSRIVAPTIDTLTEITGVAWMLGYNVSNSNGIAWRNLTVVDDIEGITGEDYEDDKLVGGTVSTMNISGKDDYFAFEFRAPAETGNEITDEAEVRVMLGDTLWKRWVDGGSVRTNVSVFNSSRKQLLITGDTASIRNILIKDNEYDVMYMSFNFLTEEVSGKDSFNYYVEMSLDSTDTIIGGEGYHIKPDVNRTLFYSNAGADKEVVIDSIYQITPATLPESTVGGWYVNGKAQEHDAMTITDTATTAGTRTYVLVQIAESDGYKDYDEVNVTTVLGRIISVIPNPATSGNVAIRYQIEDVSAASIRVVQVSSGLDVGSSPYSITVGGKHTLNVDVTGYTNGAYSIILVGDSQTIDTETLIKQ